MSLANLALLLIPLIVLAGLFALCDAQLSLADDRRPALFYRPAADEAWPHGVQEDDDARWRWDPAGPGVDGDDEPPLRLIRVGPGRSIRG